MNCQAKVQVQKKIQVSSLLIKAMAPDCLEGEESGGDFSLHQKSSQSQDQLSLRQSFAQDSFQV